MRSLFSFPLGLPRSGVFPPSLASFLSALAFPPGFGVSAAPPPVPEWVSGGWEVQLGVGHGDRLGYLGNWGEGGVWEQRVKNRFLYHCLSASLSLSVSLFLPSLKSKLGRWLGRGPKDPEVISL